MFNTTSNAAQTAHQADDPAEPTRGRQNTTKTLVKR